VACGGGTGERARGEGGGESESETGLGTVAGRGRELKEDGTRVFGRKGTPRRAGPPAGGGQFAAPFFLIHLASPPTRPSLSRLPGSPSLSLRQSIGCEILLSLSFSPSLSLSLSLSLSSRFEIYPRFISGISVRAADFLCERGTGGL